MSPLRVLIDGTNMSHRDFHTVGVSSIYDLTCKRLRAIQNSRHWQPKEMMAAFDLPLATFRHQLEPAYKAGRSKPDGIDEAIEQTQLACLDCGVDVVSSPGFEADDVIATLTRIGLEKGQRVVVVSADKDLHQLLREGWVSQAIALKRREDQINGFFVTADSLESKYHVTPSQWVEYRMLIGDESDGIKGVPSVGPTTAQQLLADGKTLADFFANPLASGIAEKARVRLLNAKETLLPKLRTLLTLRDDVPLAGSGWSR